MTEYIKVIGECEDRHVVGGKGSSLSIMHNMGLPVPPGFTITMDAWRAVRSGDLKFNQLWKMVAEQLETTFPKFGEGQLLSVRSGAEQSMPGMMDTILNVGVSTEDSPGMRLNFWKSFCLALGVSRESIQNAIDAVLVKRGVFFIDSLGGSDIASIISAMSSLAKETGSIPQTKHNLLKRAIQLVFDSWDSERAVAYRNQFGISHDGGTACTIQLIVSGLNGGSGVYLTRNPQTGDSEPYIDWAEKAQGDSVVDGSCTPSNAESLKSLMPDIYAELIGIGRKLEAAYRDAMDIEFTVDGGKLYILQCRKMKRTPSARARIVVDLALDGLSDKSDILSYNEPPLTTTTVTTKTAQVPFTKTTAVMPALVRGKITLRETPPSDDLIIVRQNTTTDDLPFMLKAKAVVTIVGGPTCHAALVARESQVPTFVGASGCYVDGTRLKSDLTFLKEGDVVTILPNGCLYKGDIQTVEVSEIDPNYARIVNLKKLLEAS